MKYYAVKKGRHPGIYNTWEECQNEVNQFKNAQFKSFTSKEEAWNYLNENTQKTDKPSLSKDQYNAYNQLISGKNIFLTGDAGTGKSFVLKLFISEMEKQNKKVIVCAPTGIAAINIQGVTIHRCFQVSPEPQVIKHIQKVPQVVQESDIIIIDEISMCRVDLFDFVVRTITKAEEKSLSRKQIVVVGDFFQLPPVTTDNDREVLEKIYEHYHKGYAFESTNWKDLDFQTVELKEVIRQKDPEFVHELNKARIGDYSCVSYFNTHSQKELFENGLNDVLEGYGLEPTQLKQLASIDLKKEESAILAYAQKYKVPFATYPAEQLEKITEVSATSRFVKQVTGVDNVCERAARTADADGELLCPKCIREQMTVAMTETEVTLEF